VDELVVPSSGSMIQCTRTRRPDPPWHRIPPARIGVAGVGAVQDLDDRCSAALSTFE